MKWLKSLWARRWVRISLLHVLGIGTFGIFAILCSHYLGSACPSYLFFKLCCPYCGMTRAHLAALRLDFASAFYYHPAFVTGIPFLWMIFHPGLFKKKWQRVLWWVLTCLLGGILAVTYIVRVCLFGFDFFM